jgi:hypothetical protein
VKAEEGRDPRQLFKGKVGMRLKKERGEDKSQGAEKDERFFYFFLFIQ